MRKGDLKDMMSKRTPLAQREVVEPVDMYTSPQVDKPTNQQGGKGSSRQGDNPTSQLTEKSTNPQADKRGRPHVEKYTTHLRPETIKAIKLAAVEGDQRDYEIVQQALDAYLQQGAVTDRGVDKTG